MATTPTPHRKSSARRSKRRVKQQYHMLPVVRLICSIARSMGATVVLEDEFRSVGYIRFRNGKRTFFRMSLLSINTTGATEMARDKHFARFFLHRFGYLVPQEQTFFSDEWAQRLGTKRTLDAAAAYARSLAYPVIVKPNQLSQGKLVAKVRSQRELRRIGKKILDLGCILLVQQFVSGRDYRVVVLDGEVLSAYERIPFFVVGDGTSTVEKLATDKLKQLQRQGREAYLNIHDEQIRWKLKEQSMRLKSVPSLGQRIVIIDAANLSTGGESADVTLHMHEDYRKLCIAITRDMGLRLCGVDLITSDITRPLDPQYRILEINASPSLDHYAAAGTQQKNIARKLYTRVLKAIEQGAGLVE